MFQICFISSNLFQLFQLFQITEKKRCRGMTKLGVVFSMTGGEGRKERGKRKGEKGKRKENFAQRSSLIFFLSEIQKQNVGDHGRRPSIVCCLLNILNCEPGSNELLQNHIK